MRKTLFFALFLFAALPFCHGQSLNVEQFEGVNVGEKLTKAQGQCLGSPTPCFLNISPKLAVYSAGTLPAVCAVCTWVDYRTPGQVTYTNATTSQVIPSASTATFADGNTTTPSITFTNDLTTGFFNHASGVGVIVGGVEKARFNGSGLQFKSDGCFGFGSGVVGTGTDSQFSRNGVGVINVDGATCGGGLGKLKLRRLSFGGATNLVAGDFALSAGWGTTASISTVTANSKDTMGSIAITSSGTGQAANPTVTLTFKDGTYATAPQCMVYRGDSTSPVTGSPIVSSISATSVAFAMNGTPVSASSYVLGWICLAVNP